MLFLVILSYGFPEYVTNILRNVFDGFWKEQSTSSTVCLQLGPPSASFVIDTPQNVLVLDPFENSRAYRRGILESNILLEQ